MTLVVLVSLITPVLTSGCSARTATACEGRVFLEDRAAPAAQGPELNSEDQVSLDRMRGKPVVVNFWGSWCGPCREEAPVLSSAWRELSETVAFLGVDIRDERSAARSFAREFGLGFPHIFDDDARIAAAWAVPSPPATFVVDAEGRLVARLVGTLTPADLECMLSLAR